MRVVCVVSCLSGSLCVRSKSRRVCAFTDCTYGDVFNAHTSRSTHTYTTTHHNVTAHTTTCPHNNNNTPHPHIHIHTLTTPRHDTTRHDTTQHTTAHHSTPQHTTAHHSTPQHSTAQHSTPHHTTPHHTHIHTSKFTLLHTPDTHPHAHSKHPHTDNRQHGTHRSPSPGGLGTVSPLHASEVPWIMRNQGLLLGCAVVLILCVQVDFFLHAVVGLQASPRFSAVGALSPSRQIPGARSTADRQATCQVASTQAVLSENESTKVCVPLAHDSELVDLLARKVVLWITPSGGTPKQQCEDHPPGPVGRWSI